VTEVVFPKYVRKSMISPMFPFSTFAINITNPYVGLKSKSAAVGAVKFAVYRA